MTYDRQILQILTDVGERGISVQLLSKHLYNLNVSFFAVQDLDEIKSYVRKYLSRNSRSPQSLIQSTGKRGYYRLNTQNNADARQLMLEFRKSKVLEDSVESEEPVRQQDLSLDLFG